MPIIIIAADMDQEVAQPTVPVETTVQPVSVQPDRPVPSPQLDDLYALVQKYKNPQSPTDRDDAIDAIFNHEYHGSTIGSWMTYKLKNSDNPRQEAMLLIMYVLDRYKPGEKFLAKLNDEVRGHLGSTHTTGLEESQTSGPQSRTMEAAMQRFLPYLKGTQKIDDDIANQFPDKSQQIWEQYRRDAWNNTDNRIDKAKAWMVHAVGELARTNPALATQFAGFSGKMNAKDYQIARNILSAAGLGQQIEDRNSPNWLTQEMVDPAKRGIGPSYIARALQQGLGGVISTDQTTPQADGGSQSADTPITSRDIERGRGYSGGNIGDMTEQERKEIRKTVPEGFRSAVPEEQAGQMEERQKLLSLEHPQNKKFVNYMLRRLYAPDSTREDEACYAVLKLMADLEPSKGNKASVEQAMKVNRGRMNRVKELPLFDRPLRLPDVPEAADPEIDANRRFSLVYSQVMKDLFKYLSNNKAYDQLKMDLGIKEAEAEEVRRRLFAMVRAASFLGLNKLANLMRE